MLIYKISKDKPDKLEIVNEDIAISTIDSAELIDIHTLEIKIANKEYDEILFIVNNYMDSVTSHLHGATAIKYNDRWYYDASRINDIIEETH